MEISQLRVGLHLHFINLELDAGDSDISVGEVWRLDVYFASDSKNFNGENK